MINSCLSGSNGFALGPRSIKDKIDKIKNESDFYENAPFLTLAKELLKLVKENKVEVIFLSAYDKRAFLDGDPRKKKIFRETFENAPDCEVVIDDNPNILKSVIENNDKIIVIAPFYSTIKHHQKVLLIKTSLSSLTVITGPMFAGKTSLLTEKYHQCKNYQPCLVFKPVIDKRYSLNDIISHSGEKIAAISITDIAEIEQYKEQEENIFIDEIHFFKSDIVPYLEELAKQGKKIIVTGLD
ncbi:5075_t:CDS:2 [Ambispora gerdemannii]|uniref:Thymidine kinase n=1 Tax=Ambispora gerdemannii TaxID=144530 RepID=A0A9N9G300_9GLOM|nr:5075_t:CDS:2 [Ambispora gerdemannii]